MSSNISVYGFELFFTDDVSQIVSVLAQILSAGAGTNMSSTQLSLQPSDGSWLHRSWNRVLRALRMDNKDKLPNVLTLLGGTSAHRSIIFR